MAYANLSAVSFVENTAQVQTPNSIFAGAMDGDRELRNKAVGGPDYVLTATQAAAESAALSVTFANLLGSAKPQVTDVTSVLVTARIYVGAALAANRAFWEVHQLFTDQSGAMTVTATTVTSIAIEGTAATDPTLTNSGSNTLAVTIVTTGAVAHSVVVELYVTRFA
jgi:hypothetical protein